MIARTRADHGSEHPPESAARRTPVARGSADPTLTATRLLPFQAVVNIPVSIYVGRISGAAVPIGLAVQLAWCVGLSMLARRLWHAAGTRLDAAGG
jgi:ABC-2 family transporter protein